MFWWPTVSVNERVPRARYCSDLGLRPDPFLVGGHPIISNLPLCGREGYFAGADLIMIEVFQPVFYVRVPLQARISSTPIEVVRLEVCL